MKSNRLQSTAAGALCAVALAVICFTSVGWTPQPASSAGATQPAPFPLATLPEAWGNPVRATKPAPLKPVQKRSSALVALPAPKSMARMPVGRVHVGEGRVNPNEAMRHKALYVIKAQAPGIVEYLYNTNGVARAGMPLVRLYDLNILSDLKIGESAMARFAASPFVIAGRQSGMPPVPPADFPKPTALQRLLGIRPVTPPAATAAVPAPLAPAPQAQLSPADRRAGLAKASGLSAEPGQSRPAPERTVKPPSVRSITHLSGEMAELHERMAALNKTLNQLEDDISSARDNLAGAKEDAAARERLYNQGVLARNVYEASKGRVSSLQAELSGLQEKRSETQQARDLLLQRIAALQGKLDEEMANRSQAASTLAAAEESVVPDRPSAALNAPTQRPERRTASRTRRAAAAPRPAPAAAWFPSPTQAPRPELSRLPRLAGRGLRMTPEVPSVPLEVKRLAAPRWIDQTAPGDGLIVRRLAPEGSQVQPGTPLLEVADREWARVYSDIETADVSRFPKGAPVRISFDNYPGVTLEGWINDLRPLKQTDTARVEMIVTAREGYCPDDTYASLEWLVLAAPLVTEDSPEALAPAVEQLTASEAGYAPVYDLLPLVPPEVGPSQETVKAVKEDEYVGLLRLGEVEGEAAAAHSKPENAKRLAALRKWRDSFTAGMTTGVFGNLVLSYPREAEIGRAVEKMASAQVTHVPNRCARTMREALGWGLGDAAVWMTRLPERGYKPRKDGLARPGDILVWPFTYGSGRSQHIGVAVNQAGRLMLLSNLDGTLGTTELLGGYVAFYKPTTPQAPAKPVIKPTKAKPVAARPRP